MDLERCVTNGSQKLQFGTPTKILVDLKFCFWKLQLICTRFVTFVQVEFCKTKKKLFGVFIAQCIMYKHKHANALYLVYHYWHHRFKLFNWEYKQFNSFKYLKLLSNQLHCLRMQSICELDRISGKKSFDLTRVNNKSNFAVCSKSWTSNEWNCLSRDFQ